MALDYEKVLNYPFEPIEQSYTERDTMLYALGLGLNHDPLDRHELQFTYEKGLKALPTMPVVLCRPGFWYQAPEFGIDWVRMLHGEQALTVRRPMPTAGTVIGQNRVTKIIDKGEGKGALLYIDRELFDKATGDSLAVMTHTLVLRGNGGFGGAKEDVPKPHAIPVRNPDLRAESAIDPRAGLIYRLSGDYNEIHADPDLAAKAGFPKPIFHGLGTFGMVIFEIIKHTCDYRAEQLTSFNLRFSAPVYPGETLRTDIWLDGNVASFRSTAIERDVVVIDNGRAVLAC
ncbi:MaoC/PaaZ C-terminal domain-containing protein [Aromatoleum toluclasticum]|uniref:MaoC/PaaZ C-terminal domain-containing protein n=1 Tax=Aromatoleum toluclasticum TaxID=92003 RepID=UPI00036313AE|nr:MaoC/PaaZ C-terminal domain-containing protein [Aromatoleum toluclasticum]